MAEVESLLRERGQLIDENQQVKAKYKKSLQELMHILKVNKSLKECLDAHSRSLDNALAQQHATLTQQHTAQLTAYQQQLNHYKHALAQQTHLTELLQQTNTQLQQQLISESHKQGIWEQGEREALLSEAERLREKVRELTGELLAEKERYRSDIFSKETEILRSKESESQRLRTIQSKYQLLESELHNYKTAEKYLEEEAGSMEDEETLYNSIRQQLTRISQDFNKYQLQSSHLLLKKREEEAERNRKIISLERDNANLTASLEQITNQLKETQAENLQLKTLQERLKVIESERDQALEKAHVLQALTLTERHRPHSAISERIRQFEGRVRILLEDSSTHSTQGQGVQQVIVLKGYVRELSELLQQARKKEDHATKKYQQQKEKWTLAEQTYRTKQQEMKARLKGYDALVAKLYAALEDKLKERIPQELQKEFNTAIAHYEQKMMQMSEDIIKLRAKITELQAVKEQPQQEKVEVPQQQSESNTYKEVISELSIKINQLQTIKLKADEELKQKGRLIESLHQDISSLTAQLHQVRDQLQEQEHRNAQLQQQLQQKERISANLSRQSIDAASLIQKVNYLEFQLGRARRISRQEGAQSKLAVQEGKMAAQAQQLTEYRAEIDRLYAQLKAQKSEKHTSVVDQYSQIADLQKQIAESDLKILGLQSELHNKEAQSKEELESLRHQNRALGQQLISKHSEMLACYQQLSRKTHAQEEAARVPELERYISQLQHKNQQIIERFSLQANELNSSLLALRTTNLSLRGELDSRQDAINELKHQLFNAELRTQKEKAPSISNSMLSRESETDRAQRAERERQKEKAEKSLMVIVLLSSEVEALRLKNQQLQAMYHQDLDKYREALKQLEARQMELCNSLHLSSDLPENHPSQAFSQLSQESTAFLTTHKQQEPVTVVRSQQAGFRSQEHTQQEAGSGEATSNVSIEASPLRKRGVTIKKIG